MPSHFPPAVALPRRESLVSQTSGSIRAHLRAGHWRLRLPAERELCRHLQVSRPTLRAALHELEREGVIALEGRTRRCIAAGRRRPASAAPTRAVVLLAPWPLQVMSPTVVLVIDALRDKLARSGYILDFRVERACFSAKPARALEKIVQHLPAAAWMAFGSQAPMQRWFVQHQAPLLVIGSCGPDINLASVDSDYRAACRHAGDLLWRKGHRRIALVLPFDAYDGDVESEQGFRESLCKHPEAQLRVLRHDGSAAHLCSVLDRTLRSSRPPTSYLAFRPVHALTVAMHLMRRGLGLPQDAAVLSRDNEAYLQHTSPVLSRYAVDPDQFARKVSNAIRELAEGGALAPRAVRLMPRFIAGETV